MRRSCTSTLALLSGLLTLVAPAHAQLFSTTWATDSTVDGTGTGTLGALTLTYTTLTGGTAGTSQSANWNILKATDGVGATVSSAGILATTNAGAVTQTISFSNTILNPVLMISGADSTSTMDFSAMGSSGVTFTLLDSQHASFNSGTKIMTFPAAINSTHDGFALKLNGTFGPSNPIQFAYSTTAALDSTAFTIAAIPEPSSLALLALGGLALRQRRKRKG
jgi:PEP-CTERM motif